MSPPEDYDAWKTRRSSVEVDGGFVDRVMAKIHQSGEPRRRGTVDQSRSAGLLSRRYVAAALLVVSLGIGLIRFGSVIAFVLLTSTEGF